MRGTTIYLSSGSGIPANTTYPARSSSPNYPDPGPPSPPHWPNWPGAADTSALLLNARGSRLGSRGADKILAAIAADAGVDEARMSVSSAVRSVSASARNRSSSPGADAVSARASTVCDGASMLIDYGVWLSRLVVAVVFGLSAWGKLTDRPGTRTALGEFGLPIRWVPAVAWGLPVMKMAVGRGGVSAALLWLAGQLRVLRRRLDEHALSKLGA